METEYIEKQAALDIVNGWRNQLIPTYGENDEYVKCLETVAEHLESLHAADVRPVRRGRWITDRTDKWVCSECQVGNNYAYSWDSITKDYTHLQDFFCPNCGAEMEVDEDG